MNDNGWERWLHVGGSLASLAALGYLLTHLPRRGERATVAGLKGSRRGGNFYLDGLGGVRDGKKAEALIAKMLQHLQSAEAEVFTLPASLSRESDAVVLRYLLEQSQEAGKRVRSKAHFEATGTLDGLPKTGRIPMKTAQRALKKLPKRSRACKGMTAAALREGMEIEREHRDITGGRVGMTAKIAASHICERPDYYRRIKRFVER